MASPLVFDIQLRVARSFTFELIAYFFVDQHRVVVDSMKKRKKKGREKEKGEEE